MSDIKDNGVITRINKLGGSGFLQGDSGRGHTFFPKDAPEFEHLQAGDRVMFTTELNSSGPDWLAREVRLIGQRREIVAAHPTHRQLFGLALTGHERL
jgi:cold shock CspA family protein